MPSGQTATYENLLLPDTLLHVRHSDDTEDYAWDTLSGDTVLAMTIITTPHQQFAMVLNDSSEVIVSVAEMLGLGDEAGAGCSGGGDPYLDTLEMMGDTLVPDASYYIQDHLGNTRVLYHTACDSGGVSYPRWHTTRLILKKSVARW